jgi:hypothetical protein
VTKPSPNTPTALENRAVAARPGNGAPNERIFLERIASYRGESREALDLSSNIGCIILQSPFFLPEDLWIDVPASLSLNRQQGEVMDATTGSGKALFEQATAAMQAMPRSIPKPAAVNEPMFGDPVLTRRSRTGKVFSPVTAHRLA